MVQSKNLNLQVRGLRHSATVAINERSNALRRAGRRVMKLGLGQSPFPVPKSVVASLVEHANEKDYLPVQGLEPLREAVVRYTARSAGVERAARDVLIGPGSKELMFLLQLAHYGDLVVPSPAWVSYAPQAQILGRAVRTLPTHASDGYMLAPETFERFAAEDSGRPRVLILNYPSNPTGATFSEPELRAIAEVARRHEIVLLSDEIYGELHHEGAHASIAPFYPEGTIISSGLSKWCGAGGWRLGTFVFPEELRWLLDAMSAVASETFTSTSAPIQYAAVTAFEGSSELEDYLARSRRVLGALGRRAWERLASMNVSAPRPAGGFYLFADFGAHREALARRGITTSAALSERLLEETGVAILPGSDFGRPPDELTTRLAYVDFDGERALSDAGPDATLDVAFLERHCPNVTGALDAIEGFLRAG